MIRARAVVQKTSGDACFLIFIDQPAERKLEDAYLPARDLKGVFAGDEVDVMVRPPGRGGGRPEVLGVKLAKRRARELVGKWNQGRVIVRRRKQTEELAVELTGAPPAEGAWIRVGISPDPHGKSKILEVYGKDLPAKADVELIAREFGLEETHSDAAKAEARQLGEVDWKPGQGGRVDLRQIPFVTIDGKTARDFDDAVYVEQLGKGKQPGYKLWVAVADVSHYVREGTALDHEARSRATSVYFPEKAFHMLPSELAEGLCSLRPNQARYAMVATIEYRPDMSIAKREVVQAVIESKRRATYEEVQEELKQIKPGDFFYAHHGLYQALRAHRLERGSVDFDLSEAELDLDAEGNVNSITKRQRLDAHRLIEEFMIAANESVTEWMIARDFPFVYRVHEPPSDESLLKFAEVARRFGVSFKTKDLTKASEDPRVLTDVLKRLQGHRSEQLLNFALLRSMKQAAYQATNFGHYGLASQAYTHFTSPIRRYPDLVVHRLLRTALEHPQSLPKGDSSERKRFDHDLQRICEHCSQRERVASECERESIRLKRARLMTRFLGREFEGQVTGVTSGGCYVQLDDPFVEGWVPISPTERFDENQLSIADYRSGARISAGQRAKVALVRADIERREIVFSWVRTGSNAQGRAMSEVEPRSERKRGRYRDKTRADDRRDSEGKSGPRPWDASRGGKAEVRRPDDRSDRDGGEPRGGGQSRGKRRGRR